MPVNLTTVNDLLERLSSHSDGESGSDVRHWHGLIERQFKLTQQSTRQIVFWERSVSGSRRRLP